LHPIGSHKKSPKKLGDAVGFGIKMNAYQAFGYIIVAYLLNWVINMTPFDLKMLHEA